MNRDGGGLWQVFRTGLDGASIQQLTFEPLNVDAYDVSPTDGALAFVTNNQLFLADALARAAACSSTAVPGRQQSLD